MSTPSLAVAQTVGGREQVSISEPVSETCQKPVWFFARSKGSVLDKSQASRSYQFPNYVEICPPNLASSISPSNVGTWSRYVSMMYSKSPVRSWPCIQHDFVNTTHQWCMQRGRLSMNIYCHNMICHNIILIILVCYYYCSCIISWFRMPRKVLIPKKWE